MKRKGRVTLERGELAKIADELERLFQHQSEMTKWEAFVGLTPAERGEYEQIGERIRELFVQLARINSGQSS